MTKIKLKELYESGLIFYPITHVKAIRGLSIATETEDGLMSKKDKIKLNNFNSTGPNRLGSVFHKEVNNYDSNY